MKISKEFQNSNPINIKQTTRQQREKQVSKIHINSTGRLFGITNRHDDYLEIKIAEVENKKIIEVRPSKPSSATAIKSSTQSTGTPFVEFSRICKKWYGKDKSKWAHKLKLIEATKNASYYEVIEEKSNKVTEYSFRQKIKKPTSKTNFKKLDLPIGSKLKFHNKDTANYVTIDNVNKIINLTTGTIGTISGTASQILGYQADGYKYFSHDGELLSNLRESKQKKGTKK